MFDVIWSADLDKMPKPGWLIDGVIPSAEDGACLTLIGEEGAGKSFVALDFACHVATGKDWFGHTISSSGLVLYIAGERASEVPKRIRAWETHHNDGQPVTQIGFILQPIELMDYKAFSELLDTIDRTFSVVPKLIIVDTLSSCQTGADENTSKDASVIRTRIRDLQSRYKTTVLITHHFNKAKTSGRGSNILPGHADMELTLTKKELGGTLKTRKVNKAAPFTFDLRYQVVGSEPEDTLVLSSVKSQQVNGPTKGAVIEVDWMENIRAAKGTSEWSVQDVMEISGLSLSTLKRRLTSDGIEKAGHGRYRLRG